MTEPPVQRWTIHTFKRDRGWRDLPDEFVGTKAEVDAFCARLCVERHEAVNATSVDDDTKPTSDPR